MPPIVGLTIYGQMCVGGTARFGRDTAGSSSRLLVRTGTDFSHLEARRINVENVHEHDFEPRKVMQLNLSSPIFISSTLLEELLGTPQQLIHTIHFDI